MEPDTREGTATRGVLIFGMHGSGVSLVAEMLGACGMRFDASEHVANAETHGQNTELRKVCDTYFRAARSSWWQPIVFDPGSVPSAVKRDLNQQVTHIVRTQTNLGLWGLAEPSLSLLLPEFHSHFEGAVCIIPVRNPVETAKWLRKQHGMSLSHGIALWEVYMRRALAASDPNRHVLVSYSDLDRNPESTLRHLVEQLKAAGLSGFEDPPHGFMKSQSNLEAETATEAELRGLLTQEQRSLWEALSSDGFTTLDDPDVSSSTLLQLEDLGIQFQRAKAAELDLEHAETQGDELRAQVREIQRELDRSHSLVEQLQNELTSARQNPFEALRRKAVAAILFGLAKQRWLFSDRRRTKFLLSAQKRNPRPTHTTNKTTIADALLASKVSSKSPTIAPAEARRVLAEELPILRSGASPQRLLPEFNSALAAQYVAAAQALYDDDCTALKVTVVIPTYNRGPQIEAAVRSVLGQSHENLELIVVDDGSTDDTQIRLSHFSQDTRLRVLSESHLGVSEARNAGLKRASGDYVFYLDSDNTWPPDHVRLTLSGLRATGADCGYSASCVVDQNNQLIGFRGEPFDWDACLIANYVDMNVFAHKRELFDELGGFDGDLRRMVDWDLVLRYTKSRTVQYFPFIGCIYLEDKGDKTRVSLSQPDLFERVVIEKNKQGLTRGAVALAELKLSFAIKIGAPYKSRAEWGDFHYAESLSNALQSLGHSARIDFHGEWEKPQARNDDVIIVLRGLSGYTAPPDKLTFLWNISHPDQVLYEEYKTFSRVFVASRSYSALLSLILEKPVYPLLQCSDTDRFHLPEDPAQPDQDAHGVFVGNSRNEFRPMVRWSAENKIDVEIYGTRWEQFIPEALLAGQNVPNTELGKKYRSARFVLNDHWQSMKDFGFVSNRVFDVVGCGGRLISDRLPALDALFGDAVETVENETEFLNAVSGPALSQETRRAAADYVAHNHSFAARARTICEAVQSTMTTASGEPQAEPNFIPSKRRRRIGLILQRGYAWWTSSAYIRLIAPLTTDHAYEIGGLDVVALDGVDDPRLESCDVCIVQRVGVRKLEDARRLIQSLSKNDIPLFVDTDDAFFLHEAYRAADESLRLLMEAAQEVWFSTATLAALYEDVAIDRSRIRANNLDPRFWLDYRKPARWTFEDTKPVRFLYMGTATHHEDLAIVMPAFERLAQSHPGQFELTLVGVTTTPPQAEWLRVLNAPQSSGAYPAFVRFLMSELECDVGIAPLVASPFNAAKSDVKFLDYSAMGLLSVVSDGPAYSDCINANLAVGCANTSDAWYEALSSVVRDKEAFAEMRSSAAQHVWAARNVLLDPDPLSDLLISN